jgi:hypothetical protein
MRFRTTVVLGGKTATGFQVPAEVVEALGSGKKPRVHVTIGDHAYRSTVAVYGGKFFLPLNAANRASAGVAAGDDIDVGLELDTQPREVTVPSDVRAALHGDPVVHRRFERLSYSKQREYIESIEAAKTTDTRQRRLHKMIEALQDDRTPEPRPAVSG